MSTLEKRDTGATGDVKAVMADLGQAARKAYRTLASASHESKNVALRAAARSLRAHAADIIAANARDMANAESMNLSEAMLDRLKLTEDRIEGMATGLEEIAELDDPVGEVIDEWSRPNGLRIARVRVPLGVIAVIYESRPNVTADAGALCLKAGNAAILRGGSEAVESNHAILACLREGLSEAGLPEASIQLVPTQDRAAVGEILRMTGIIDVVVPRGGRSLVERVQEEARVPVFAHLDGVCHTYIHSGATANKAREISVNAKMRRTGICGTTETLLIDRDVAPELLPDIAGALIEAGCALRGDEEARSIDARIEPATEKDWSTEYLDAILSIRVVGGIDEAIEHIATYGSGHTEAIVTENEAAAEDFLERVDSAIVMHNTSTQFADGGEFGMGAEIGISTGRMHARGPVGVEQLTSFKYAVRGQGQVRP